MAYDALTTVTATGHNNNNHNDNSSSSTNSNNVLDNSSYNTTIIHAALTAVQTTAAATATATTTINYMAAAGADATPQQPNEIKWRNVSALLTKDNTNTFVTAIRANVTSLLNAYIQHTTAIATSPNEFDYTPNITIATKITSAGSSSSTKTSTVPQSPNIASNASSNYVDGPRHHHQISSSSANTSTAGNVMNISDVAAAATLTQLSMATAKTAASNSNPTIIVNTTKSTITAAINSSSNSTIGGQASSITFPRYPIHNNDNCSSIFADYVYPPAAAAKEKFCNWTWDGYLCWPTTPAGVVARMYCPSGWLGVNPRKYANRKCDLDGHWGGRPNETHSAHGWTDFQPCFKPEVTELLQKIRDPTVFYEIAMRTRTLEIVGLVLSLVALIASLAIFCNFRSLRNNRTKIHKNLFIAMILQVIVRLTLYSDQAFRRGDDTEATATTNMHGIQNTPYLCEASYILLEYAKTAMFMWMWIEGFYLHNMVATLAVFHGGFPHTIFSLIGWFFPFLITVAWAICTALYMDTDGYCWWNYNLTSYYWILEGPRSLVILLNFFFLINIIRVLVVKLRESQASDVEQTRKAVKAAIVLLPLLGITNLLYLLPTFETPWKFALWSYITHFLTSFQGFFIALIYCFLNGEVRTVLLKSIAVFMSVRGHPEWVPKQGSMFSGAYNTAADTEAPPGQEDLRRHVDGQSTTAAAGATAVTKHRRSGSVHHNTVKKLKSNSSKHRAENRRNCLITLCFRGQKVLRPPATSDVPPETNV